MQIGIDNSELVCKRERPKSIGNSVTLPRDLRTEGEIQKILLTLSEQIAYRLRKEGLLANIVNVQLRTKDFKDFSHQRRLDFAVSNTKEIYYAAEGLLKDMFVRGMAIRLVGLRADNLIDKNEMQLSLFSNSDNEKQDKLESTIDEIKQKYGYDFITRAGNLDVDETVKNKRKD